jgi:hypothetical protein
MCTLLTGAAGVIGYAGAVMCWGSNNYGQLGLGNTANRGDGPNQMGANLAAVDLGPGAQAVAVVAGAGHTCALLTGAGYAGKVKCWGTNSYGQLGQGDTANRGDGPNEMGATLRPWTWAHGFSAAKRAGRLRPLRLGLTTPVSPTASIPAQCALIHCNNPTQPNTRAIILAQFPGVLDPGSVLFPVMYAASVFAVKCWGMSYHGALGLADFAIHGDGPGEMGDNLDLSYKSGTHIRCRSGQPCWTVCVMQPC